MAYFELNWKYINKEKENISRELSCALLWSAPRSLNMIVHWSMFKQTINSTVYPTKLQQTTRNWFIISQFWERERKKERVKENHSLKTNCFEFHFYVEIRFLINFDSPLRNDKINVRTNDNTIENKIKNMYFQWRKRCQSIAIWRIFKVERAWNTFCIGEKLVWMRLFHLKIMRLSTGKYLVVHANPFKMPFILSQHS